MQNDQRLLAFKRLLDIMDDLRAKCPWDKEQTMSSLRHLTIEETYELCDAIIKKDWNGLKEELGDVLLHLVFYAKIASEQNQFNFNDVIEAVCNKLVYRHPHIYSNVKVSNEQEVKENWEKFTLWERSLRAPLFFIAPGITKAGSSSNVPVSAIDIFPTLAELIGEKLPIYNDGESLAPMLKNKSFKITLYCVVS